MDSPTKNVKKATGIIQTASLVKGHQLLTNCTSDIDITFQRLAMVSQFCAWCLHTNYPAPYLKHEVSAG
jgi:hypothetical protein